MTPNEVEELVVAMERVADSPVECGPAPERCVNANKGAGRSCTVHIEREREMSRAFWKVWDATQ